RNAATSSRFEPRGVVVSIHRATRGTRPAGVAVPRGTRPAGRGALLEDDGARPVEQHAVLGEPRDGLGEGAALLVLADRDELGGRARVVDPHDVLLDDGALVEV